MATNSQYSGTTKYVIVARFDVEGVVEKPDVIGAIFGQTEGLFGPDLDLRELQKTGRIGRIEIQIESKQDRTQGNITIPSSLDKTSTAIIAAAVESVDRIGPCAAKVTLDKVVDVREEKRRAILDKAKTILHKWVVEVSPSTDEVVKEVSDVIRPTGIVEFGPEKLPAGSEIVGSSSIILVEGRADVINLSRCGIRNVVGIEGTKIPNSIIELCKTKETTAFLDGDRGGDLILKELMQVCPISYVARAPIGREVEELTPRDVVRCLREKLPVGATARPEREKVFEQPRPPIQLPEDLLAKAKELRGTLEALLLNERMEVIARLPVSELAGKLGSYEGVNTVIFDGIVTQRLLDLAEQRGVRLIVGDRLAEIARKPHTITVTTLPNVLGS